MSRRSSAFLLWAFAGAECAVGCGGASELTGLKPGQGGTSGSDNDSNAHQGGASLNGGTSGVTASAHTGGLVTGGASFCFGGTLSSGSGGTQVRAAASGGTIATGGGGTGATGVTSQGKGGTPQTGGVSARGSSAGSSAIAGGDNSVPLGGTRASGGTAAASGGTSNSATGGGCIRAANILSDFESGKGTLYPVPRGVVNGFWYVFSDTDSCGSAAQIPIPVPGAAIAAQLLPADDPRKSECNQYAMHSSIDQCQTFSGFGAVLAPETDGAVNNMPIDLSAYDGLSFWIKAGSSTTGPIFVEVLDPGCVPPPPDGSGVATNEATDRYNCHGALLKKVSTDWQQVFIPFGTLGPRWIPTRYSSNNPYSWCSSSDFCEAPAVDTQHVFGIQFSLEEPWTKIPLSATSTSTLSRRSRNQTGALGFQVSGIRCQLPEIAGSGRAYV